jgi:hypothetical protein
MQLDLQLNNEAYSDSEKIILSFHKDVTTKSSFP